LLRKDNAQSWEVQIEDVKNMLEDSGIAVFGTLNKNEENSEKELVKSITYPFYNKTLKDSKKLLIHLDTLEDVGLAESQVIIEALRDESSKEIEDILFSLRIDTHLKNRIEAIEAEKANHCLTRLGIVVTTEKQPIDSVTFFDYNNEIITCTDNVGFFKITREKEVFIHAIILKKKDYITDTIHYYNKEINEWDPVYRGYNDTIVLKREEK